MQQSKMLHDLKQSTESKNENACDLDSNKILFQEHGEVTKDCVLFSFLSKPYTQPGPWTGYPEIKNPTFYRLGQQAPKDCAFQESSSTIWFVTSCQVLIW